MLSFLFLFLFLVSGSVSLQISAPSVVTAGQTTAVTWTRNLPIDPREFTLQIRGDNDNPDIHVDSKGQKTGQASFTPKSTGKYEVTAAVGKLPLVPTKQRFTVNPPGPPPSKDPPLPPKGSPPPPNNEQSATSQSTASSTQAQATTSRTISSQGTTTTQATSLLTTASNQTSSAQLSPNTLASGSTVATESSSSSISSSTSISVSVNEAPTGYDATGSPSDTLGQPGATATAAPAAAVAQKSNSGIIAGTVTGVLLFIALVALLYLCRRHRRRGTQFYRDMMVRRKSQALLFSQVTTPSVRAATTEGQFTGFGPDAEKMGEAYEEQPYVIPPVQISSHSLDIQDAPWTDRQIHIHTKILDLRGKLLAKQSWSSFSDTAEEYDADDLKARIRRLEDLIQSAWALGFTDEVPLGYE